ncbi:MAG: hypothetical protein ABEI86_08135, partial [Halobacteriaceae archaeon]
FGRHRAYNLSELSMQGNIVMHGNYISNDGDDEGIRIDGSGNIKIPDSNLDVSSPTETGHIVDIGGSLGLEGKLDMNSNSLNSLNNLNMVKGSSGDMAIEFQNDAWGGSGDDAFIRYHQDGNSENTELKIGISNDGEDNIELTTGGGKIDIRSSTINMNSNYIVGLATPNSPQDAATKGYVDSSDDTVADDQSLSEVLSLGNSAGSYSINMNSNRITGLADPSNAQDAATKSYVDSNEQTIADDQGLGYNNLNSPTGDYATHEVTISGGSNTDIRDYYDPNSDTQDLSITGHTISLDRGGSVTVPDQYEADTDTQDLSISGDTISLDRGGSVTVNDAYDPDTTIADNQDLSNVLSNGADASDMNLGGSGGVRRLNFHNHEASDFSCGDNEGDSGIFYDRSEGLYICRKGNKYKIADQGNSVNVEDTTIADTQDLSISGDTISLDRGGSVTVNDADTTVNGCNGCLTIKDSNDGSGEVTPGNDLQIKDTVMADRAVFGRVHIGGAYGDISHATGGTIDFGNSQTVTDVDIAGSLSKNSGSFVIDHPLNDSKVLRHGFSEAPRRNVFYQGTARLENGSKTIELPRYYEALTQNDTAYIQLTPVEGWSPLYVEEGKVENGEFTVKTTENGDPNQKFDWRVDAERGDEYVMNQDSQTYHSGPKKGDLIVVEEKENQTRMNASMRRKAGLPVPGNSTS